MKRIIVESPNNSYFPRAQINHNAQINIQLYINSSFLNFIVSFKYTENNPSVDKVHETLIVSMIAFKGALVMKRL